MFERLTLALCAILAMVALAGGAPAQSVSEADATSFRQIISDQIAAFNADDGPKAWSFASPSIQQLFPTPEVFMSMVRQGYQPVYRQKSFTFGEITDNDGRFIQHVTIVDANGKLWTALYTMQKQPDGTWKISGCALVEVPAVST
jgi:Domain of unknown function (DUF4864)